jgi:predicted TIM-barrel fold metal-dependent hydrolase
MYKGRIIDCDVHHIWSSGAQSGNRDISTRIPVDITDRLPEEWREVASGVLGGALPIVGPGVSSGSLGGGAMMDSYPADGNPPGSSYELLCEQLLDPYDVERAILGFDSGDNNALQNPYFAQAVVRAMNDWNLDTWLSIPDDRLCSVIVIPSQLIDEAVAEIERIGPHPRIVSGLFSWNAFGKPLGHPVYHPIYAALAEQELTLNVHIGPGEFANKGGGHAIAAGTISNYYELHVLWPQIMMHHLASMLVHGVFEKFPGFKLVCIEASVGWLPWVVSNLDANYRLLRRESPWLKRKPSEYLRDHVRLTTQPLDTSPDPKQLVQVLETVEGIEDMLCFSTDYPHWDSDDPRHVARRLPASWQEKVFHTNALEAFRWPAVAPAAARA